MSKAKRMREMQQEINELTDENQELRKVIKKHNERDRGMLRDYVKHKEKHGKEQRDRVGKLG